MAEEIVPGGRCVYGKYMYTPPTAIRLKPYRSDETRDFYRGTKDELVAAGLAPAELFPGEPGMPLTTVPLTPIGARSTGSCWVPGRLSITKNPSGKFTAALVPSAEELQRREAQRQAERARTAAAAVAHDADAMHAAQSARHALGYVIATLGPSEVLRLVKALPGATPTRTTSTRKHLRLVWSASDA